MAKAPRNIADLVPSVLRVLQRYAARGRLVSFGQIEAEIGAAIPRSEWSQILDPIYEECIARNDPDITAIIVYGSGDKKNYPAYFSEGQKARSIRFNVYDAKQLERWSREVRRVFDQYELRK